MEQKMSIQTKTSTTNYCKQFFAGATVFLLAGMTHASQAVVTFTGTINDSWDLTGSTFAAGQGYGTMANKTVVQEFTFDSTVLPSQLENEPLSARYLLPFSPTTLSASWINVKTTIDGVEIIGPASETPGANAFTNVDGLTITDGNQPGFATGSDYFDIDQGSQNLVRNNNIDFYTNTTSFVSIRQDSNFIEGINLDQNFTLDITSGYFFGGGRAYWGTVSISNGKSTTVSEGYVSYMVKSVTYTTISSVPEPSTLILMLAGTSIMGLRRRNPTKY
jgi:PEP-CTERM motif